MKSTLDNLMSAPRVLFGTLLLACIVGPTPGSAGSCSESEFSVAEYPQFCVDRREAFCRRERSRCLTAGQPQPGCNAAYNTCVAPLIADCERTPDWPEGCNPPPTESEASGCIDALLDPANLAINDQDWQIEIPECAVICN